MPPGRRMKAVQREARAERQPYEEALTCPFDVFAKQVEPPAERLYPGFDLREMSSLSRAQCFLKYPQGIFVASASKAIAGMAVIVGGWTSNAVASRSNPKATASTN
jgi:hypothetical protein